VRVLDPTTVAIEDQIAERDRLRAEVDRLSGIVDAEFAKVDAEFAKGYDQAVRAIRDHFAKSGQHGVVAEIDATFGKVGVS
jgi:hypothetical protein